MNGSRLCQKIKSGILTSPKVSVFFKIDFKVGYPQIKLLLQERKLTANYHFYSYMPVIAYFIPICTAHQLKFKFETLNDPKCSKGMVK